MMVRILSNLNGRLIVNEKSGSGRAWIAKLSKNASHPLDFLASLDCSNILCLCSRQSNPEGLDSGVLMSSAGLTQKLTQPLTQR